MKYEGFIFGSSLLFGCKRDANAQVWWSPYGLEITKVEKNVKEDIELNISVISNVRWAQTHWIQNK